MTLLFIVIPTRARRSSFQVSVILTEGQRSNSQTSVIPTEAERSERSGGTCFLSAAQRNPPCHRP